MGGPGREVRVRRLGWEASSAVAALRRHGATMGVTVYPPQQGSYLPKGSGGASRVGCDRRGDGKSEAWLAH